MHEFFQKATNNLRGGVAFCLALLFLGTLSTSAAAAESRQQVSAAQTLIPVGHTVGIELFSRGLLVVKLADGNTPAKACGLESGDLILKCNGTAVTSSEQFQDLIREAESDPVQLQVRRDTDTLTLTVTPSSDDSGNKTIGAWIRDSMAGIGTVTFYDPATGVFGALGHGITDVDTAQLMPFASGSILPSSVKAVKQGQAGDAGELRGNFDLTTNLGDLYANTQSGIFGVLDEQVSQLKAGDALPVAENDEIHTGSATILANVSGDEVQEYDIEISKLFDSDGDSRNMLLTVTDPELLGITGGIVQGMSGSPILQDGKIVGAVTHVLLNDPTKGYGIFIRNMLEAAK